MTWTQLSHLIVKPEGASYKGSSNSIIIEFHQKVFTVVVEGSMTKLESVQLSFIHNYSVDTQLDYLSICMSAGLSASKL